MHQLQILAGQDELAVSPAQRAARPYVIHRGVGIVDPRTDANDAVEIPREAFRLDECLTPARRTAVKIGVLRRLSIVTLRDRLTRNRHHMRPAVREVNLPLKVVLGPEPVLTLAHVAHVRRDAGVSPVQRTPPEPERCASARPAATELDELAV